MLEDAKLDSLDTRLEQFKRNNSIAQSHLQSVLKEYGQLLEEYKALKHAKALDAVQAQHAASPDSVIPRNPYVLVLVDGNGYIFNDELIREKEEGGMRAARMLNDAVEGYVRDSLPKKVFQGSRIIVRIYADLTNLSVRLAKAKLCGNEKRSLAHFTAGFTRTINFFDFMDTLDEDGTRFKIRESFKLSAEDPACSHILYAACSDPSYLSQLVPYSGCRDKISLVQGADFNSAFHQFGLNVTQFPTIFRWSDLPTAGPSAKPSHPATERNDNTLNKGWASKTSQARFDLTTRNWRETSNHNVDDALLSGSDGVVLNSFEDEEKTADNYKTRICRYFQRGKCIRGDKCSFKHGSDDVGVTDIDQLSISSATKSYPSISTLLPTSQVPGFIPVNKDNQRLDVYVPRPSQSEWSAYSTHFQHKKPCNNLYLNGLCTNGEDCIYDHSPITPVIGRVLEYVVKTSPCPQRDACRSGTCVLGHVCQKEGCAGPGKGCRMKPKMHNMDLKLASMVPAEDEWSEEDDS
ncbi:hypothetical protein DM02DRAFT_610926 [Periconia macrospinosa]|uniref:C3H1-type domain-containing protein n=1 Tax=Periconia macrospinosa TaxID=97972 RepID=A0A2V1E720_9PLEO|nr:hypothetical protein DM02DRAFT_610926 [Periconia macrospinosa]